MRVHFDREAVGRDLAGSYGLEERYKVFRYAYKDGWDQAKALFIVRFRLKNMSPRANRLFSLLPMVFVLSRRGFLAKYWLCDDATGDCIGLYHWRTRADAEAYARGPAISFMTKRSRPGSLSQEIKDL